jgi:hypothetical protein
MSPASRNARSSRTAVEGSLAEDCRARLWERGRSAIVPAVKFKCRVCPTRAADPPMGAHLPLSPAIPVRHPAPGVEPGPRRGVSSNLHLSHQENRFHPCLWCQDRGGDSDPAIRVGFEPQRLPGQIHFHMLFLDGVYRFEGPQPKFHRARRPTPAEFAHLLHNISRRMMQVYAITRREERRVKSRSCVTSASALIATALAA